MSAEARVYLTLLIASWLVIAGLIIAVLRQARVIRATRRRLRWGGAEVVFTGMAVPGSVTTTERPPATWSGSISCTDAAHGAIRRRLDDGRWPRPGADLPEPRIPAPRSAAAMAAHKDCTGLVCFNPEYREGCTRGRPSTEEGP